MSANTTTSNNPKATIDNKLIYGAAVPIIRHTYTKVDFSQQSFRVYFKDPSDVNSDWWTTFIPEGDQTFYFWDLGFAYEQSGKDKPDFVNASEWTVDGDEKTGLQRSPSGFVTTVNTMMPKLIVPSEGLVDNGLRQVTPLNTKIRDTEVTTMKDKDAFNWTVLKLNNTDVEPEGQNPKDTKWWSSVNISGGIGKQSISIMSKDDAAGAEGNTTSIYLDDPETIGNLPTGDWEPSGEIVGAGAFCIVVNVVPLVPGKAGPDKAAEKWKMQMQFGEVNMSLEDNGALTVVIGESTTKCQVTNSDSQQVPPQYKQLGGSGQKYMIAVYPVWNGVIVSNGVQDSRSQQRVSSQYCIKTKKSNMENLNEEEGTVYQRQGRGGEIGGFVTKDPKNVFIDTDKDVIVRFGKEESGGDNSRFSIVSQNCRYDTAWLPLFFTHEVLVDGYFVGQKSQAENVETGQQQVTYEYLVYSVWTDNNTSYNLSSTIETKIDINEDAEWKYVRFHLYNDKPSRYAAEVFGYILHEKESRRFSTFNGNGSFQILVNGVEHGNWQDYVKSISVSVGLDGTSGQISVDKYGLANQTDIVDQSIGALTISMTDAPKSSKLGRIFTGYGFGISDSQGSDGAEWTVELRGLETKLQDIVLINVPFFDGETVGYVIQFLCGYGGIDYHPSGSFGEFLPSSTDISVPLIDFKTGTTVIDAIDQIMELSAHNYVIQKDGIMQFYKLAADGLPVDIETHTDWKPEYPDTKVMSYDQKPDFEDLRNEIVMLGMRPMIASSKKRGTDVPNPQGLPIFPLTLLYRQYNIQPSIPWSKPMVYGVEGYTTEEKMADILPKLRALTRLYESTGSISIAGNAEIKPYDRWGNDVITSVSQNVDFQSKSWTTSLELAQGTRLIT